MISGVIRCLLSKLPPVNRTSRGAALPTDTNVSDAAGPTPKSGVRTSPTGPEAILKQLADRIQPVAVSAGYRLGLLVVAVTMVLLLGVYFGLIGLVAWATYWHAINDLSVLSSARGRNARGALVLYLAPIALGTVMLLFMIKPIFARQPKQSKPIGVTRQQEPLLFSFVERLCDIVGARRPSRIDVDTQVNASAGFREGLAGFFGGQLVLTIGLPLVAGLNMRQFAGVLAHEFGHFAQGGAMRLTFLIRKISFWFARVVYERDVWDARLEAWQAAGGWLTILIAVCRFMIWLTRRVLWCLMWVGQVVSSFMLRQMEFDADRYEARVAGSKSFEQTCEAITNFGVAAQAAFSDVQNSWQERRLPDDLPALIGNRERDMPHDIRTSIHKARLDRKTGLFDTHPADRDRIASARAEKCEGIFQIEAPARELFTDFPELSKLATLFWYQEALGKELRAENLFPTESVVKSRDERRGGIAALRRYHLDIISPVRPLFPGAPFENLAPDRAAEQILQVRCELQADQPALLTAAKQWQDEDFRLLNILRVRALNLAGIRKIKAGEFDLPAFDYDTLATMENTAASRRADARRTLDEAIGKSLRRMMLALALRRQEQPKPAPTPVAPENDSGEYELATESATGGDRLLETLRGMAAVASQVEELRVLVVQLAVLFSRVQPQENPQDLVNAILSLAARVHRLLAAIHADLRPLPYPYEHVEHNVTVSAFLLRHGVPAADNPGDIGGCAEALIEGYYDLYVRLLADLSAAAEEVETSLGFDSLPEPKAET